MAITSLSFILFVFVVILLYYALPKKFQWGILLLSSIGFYISFGIQSMIYVLITATSVYIATNAMQSITDKQKSYLKSNKGTLSKDVKKKYKQKNKRNKKIILLFTLFLNIGLLCYFKYFTFIIEQIYSLISVFNGQHINIGFSIIAPLGISFYTFQTIGYLVDVYWENYKAEKNYFKVLLFVSFFPQITQGPISDFEQLSSELFKSHRFTYKNFSYGIQRMIWGFAKKTLIADAFAPCVNDVFANYSQYAGISVFIGAVLYSIQIYADFSGYMDIMCGLCEILGIRLTENFERPYFSKSVAEYWRRWHISLGNWFKKYIYYVVGMSNWSRTIASFSKNKLGKRFSDTIPATIALVLVWLSTGLWHGASWSYIVWGLLNGLFIILTLWLEPFYGYIKKILRINEASWFWKLFQTLRTFILVTLIKVLPEVGDLSDGLGLWKQIFTNFEIPTSISGVLPFLTAAPLKIGIVLAVFFTIILFISSLLQRRKPIREYFNRLPIVLRSFILCGMVILIFSIGIQATWGEGGFLYANF